MNDIVQVICYIFARFTKGVLPKVPTPMRTQIMTIALDKVMLTLREEFWKVKEESNLDGPGIGTEYTEDNTGWHRVTSWATRCKLVFLTNKTFTGGKKTKDRCHITSAFSQKRRGWAWESCLKRNSCHEWHHTNKHAWSPLNQSSSPTAGSKARTWRYFLTRLKQTMLSVIHFAWKTVN